MKFQIENLALLNSRFVFNEFLYLDDNFHQLNLTRGSSYLPLPDWLARKKVIVNPHNDDEQCFKRSVIAEKKVGMKDPQCISNLKKFMDNYDWFGLEFPVSNKDIGRFETWNNISVNVLAAEGRDIYIYRKGQRVGREINLLMVSEDGIWHYTAIKSLSRLLSSKKSNTKCKQHFCMNCLQGFTQESSRDQHQVYCEDNESVRVEMPKQGSTIEFKDGQNQFKVPFIMYADFESILEPMDPVEPGSPNQPYTNEVDQHTPSGWCVYSKFAYGDVDNLLRTYRGKDCIETFCNYVKREAHRLYHMFPELPMDPLTKKQWKKYKRSIKCHICYKPFTLGDPKVKDHCHYTGLYRGPAHSLCNLRYKIPSYIPVVFQNLSGYDAHLFIRELGAHTSDMEVIAKNKEDYISFSIKVPVDSYIDKNGEEKDKIVMYEFHYDYMVPKYGLEKLKLCYMNTDSLVYDIKTEDFYEDIANDVEARFDTSGHSKTEFRPLPIGLNKKVIGLMKDELGGKIMTEFVVLRPKLYSYIFEDYKTCLFSNSTEYRSQLMFRSAKHEVHTIEVNKVALN